MNVTYCLDVGCPQKGPKGAAAARWTDQGLEGVWEDDQVLDQLATRIVEDVDAGRRVRLGVETPLAVPIRDDASELTRARWFEGSPCVQRWRRYVSDGHRSAVHGGTRTEAG